MTTTSNAKYASSFGLSLAITSVVSALLVPLKEKSETVMGLMKGLTGHHWISHGVLMLVLFVVLGFVLAGRQSASTEGAFKGATTAVVAGTILGGLIIAGFFLLE